VKGISMSYAEQHLKESQEIISLLKPDVIEKIVDELADLRKRCGRLFILGVGGSAANASHATNDFRKIVGIETYAPTDNVSELTARVNDEGWATTFIEWLKVSQLSKKDALLILSVGGGNREMNVSPNIIKALEFAQQIGSTILGIVGRDGGYTAKIANHCVVIPTVNPQNTTPHTEAFQGVVWHLIVSHPKLKKSETKWESIKKA